MERIYDQRYFDGNLGDAWNAVGAIGASAVQLLPSLLGPRGGSAGGPARGLAAIQAAVQQALGSLNQILQAVRGGQMSPAQAVSEATRIANALSDPQFVYQAQRGNDANALNQGKQQAASLVQQIQAAAGQTSGPPTPTGPNPAGPNPAMPSPTTPAGPPASGGGIDTQTLLLIGGGLVAVILITR